jgi:hypothetical protein
VDALPYVAKRLECGAFRRFRAAQEDHCPTLLIANPFAICHFEFS